jgi:hypothetical protein
MHRGTRVLLLVLALLHPIPAAGHTGGSTEVQVWVRPGQDLGGVEAAIDTRMAPALRLTSTDGTPVELLDADGRAYLRVDGDGVHANLASPAWVTSSDPQGLLEQPDDLPAASTWTQVSTQPTWAVYDHRLHPQPLGPPLDVAAAGEEAELGELALPLVVDGQATDLLLTELFRPSAGIHTTRLEEATVPAGTLVRVVDGAMPSVSLAVDAGRTATVAGVDDEPMLEVAADGTVRANLASPTWVDSRRAELGMVPTIVVDPTAEPVWEQVGTGGMVTWTDVRVDPALAEPTDPTAWLEEENTIGRTALPITVDDVEAEVVITNVWIRFGDPGSYLEDGAEVAGGGLPGWVRWAAMAVVAVGALTLLRRPRRRRAGPGR